MKKTVLRLGKQFLPSLMSVLSLLLSCFFLASCGKGETKKDTSIEISGGFRIGTDKFGNSIPFFQGINYGSEDVTVLVVAKNINMSEGVWQFTLLAGDSPKNTFVIGPQQGWKWQPGEKLFLYFPDGSIKAWTFETSMPSFDNNSPTVARWGKWRCKDCDKCEDFIRPRDGNDNCVNCGHSLESHK